MVCCRSGVIYYTLSIVSLVLMVCCEPGVIYYTLSILSLVLMVCCGPGVIYYTLSILSLVLMVFSKVISNILLIITIRQNKTNEFSSYALPGYFIEGSSILSIWSVCVLFVCNVMKIIARKLICFVLSNK